MFRNTLLCWMTFQSFSRLCTNLNASLFLLMGCGDGDEGGGRLWSFCWRNGSRGKSKAGFWGSFIHLSLSSYDKDQAPTKAGVRPGSVTSSWPVSPSQPLVWSLPTVYQPAEHLSTERRGGWPDWHRTQRSCSVRRNWADFTQDGVMSLVLMDVNALKPNCIWVT